MAAETDDESRWLELVRGLSEGAGLQATWVPLADAAAASGVSRSTLRLWYRSGQIPSRLEPGPHGPQRMVPRELVVERALQGRGRLGPAEPDSGERLVRNSAEREARLERRVAELEEHVEALLSRAIAAETELRLWRAGWRPPDR